MIQGIFGLIDDNFYVVTQEWVLQFNTTTWGWAHIVIGRIAVAAGGGLFTGKVWEQAAAIIVAAFSILANFTWPPDYPVWALLIIAFDVS